jgi:P-type Cu+ transporter
MMTDQQTSATDLVCGMTVEVDTARAAGLTSDREGTTYYFCGRGCELDFEEDPAKYLDPAYKPSMEM